MQDRPSRSVNREALLQAVRKGDIGSLQSMLTDGDDAVPNLSQNPDFQDATLLHHACRAGNLDVLQYLMKDAAMILTLKTDIPTGSLLDLRPDVISCVGATAALDAAATGNLDCLQYVLENSSCNISDQDQAGNTATHLSARYGHLRTLKWLVNEEPTVLQTKTKSGAIPLHFAAARGDLDSVKFIVEQRPG